MRVPVVMSYFLNITTPGANKRQFGLLSAKREWGRHASASGGRRSRAGSREAKAHAAGYFSGLRGVLMWRKRKKKRERKKEKMKKKNEKRTREPLPKLCKYFGSYWE